jgi:ABC-type uncharacterized transport system auxiliary subunit
VKWLGLFLLLVFCTTLNSCTTLANRRDLYSPEPEPDSTEAIKQSTTTTTATTTTTQMRANPTEREELPPAPPFR